MAGYDPWTYAERYKTEHTHQIALFMWANMACLFGLTAANVPESYTVKGEAIKQLHYNNDGIPQLKWLHAIHNQGHGDKVRGAQAKAEGVKAGVFDLFLPVPVRAQRADPYSIIWKCGLYLELKVGSNKPSDKQNEFSVDMQAAGYATAVAWGWLEARDKILQYLGLT